MSDKSSFEKDLSELEEIVKALEANEIELDEMIKLFEKGVKLTKSCTDALNTAEQKVTVLMKNRESGNIEEEPFAAE